MSGRSKVLGYNSLAWRVGPTSISLYAGASVRGLLNIAIARELMPTNVDQTTTQSETETMGFD